MWLRPFIPSVSNLTTRAYYRVTIAGGRVPAKGALLLVANHPNSLLDPALVAAAARRSVRFLAKAPLFTDKRIGFLVRSSGSIPVYRRIDDPDSMDGNQDMFRSVFEALKNDLGIALFPEGISHSEPSLAKLKTGAARIALGAFEHTQETFPIIPVGMVLAEKDVFRSRALVTVGEPIEWEDLAPRGQTDRHAVVELTRRIDTAIRDVTVNLETWEDKPIVECAEQIWSAEFNSDETAPEKLGRLRTASDLLSSVRQSHDARWWDLLKDIESHRRRLGVLRITPSDLSVNTRIGTAFRWTLGRLYLLAPISLILAVVGHLVFLIPYKTTGFIANRSGADEAEISTWKLFLGIPLYVGWVFLVSIATGLLFGPLVAVAVAALAPIVGVTGLWIRERWKGASQAARRFFLLRERSDLVAELRSQQKDIADRMAELVRYL